MTKPAALIREIEVNQAKLAMLQKEHSRIGQKISYLSALNKTKIIELVGTTLESLDFGEVPIHVLLSKLTKLSEELIHEGPDSDDKIAVFVRFGRNVSSANRQLLVSAGLHWHGRDGGWVGQTTAMQVARLRDAFGDRVRGAKRDEAGSSPEEPLHVAPDVISTDVAAVLSLAKDNESQAGRATHGNQLPSRLVPPSFAFSSRRPAKTEAAQEYERTADTRRHDSVDG